MKAQSHGFTSALFITPPKLGENKNFTSGQSIASMGPGEVKIAAFEAADDEDDGI